MEKKLRVVHNCQVGALDKLFYVDVNSPEEAWKIMNILWDYDIYQFENQIKPDYCNVTTLEEFDEETNEWFDWYDEEGLDIREHFEALEDE